jgi:hypothetical protein
MRPATSVVGICACCDADTVETPPLEKPSTPRWLVEHKTHRQFPPPESRWRDLQSVLYIHVAETQWDIRLRAWDRERNRQTPCAGRQRPRAFRRPPRWTLDFTATGPPTEESRLQGWQLPCPSVGRHSATGRRIRRNDRTACSLLRRIVSLMTAGTA